MPTCYLILRYQIFQYEMLGLINYYLSFLFERHKKK